MQHRRDMPPVVANAPPMRAVVRAGSAGLGIARGSYGDLHHLSAQVAKTGSVELHPVPQFAASSPRAGYGFGQAPSGGAGRGSSASAGHASSGGGHTAH